MKYRNLICLSLSADGFRLISESVSHSDNVKGSVTVSHSRLSVYFRYLRFRMAGKESGSRRGQVRLTADSGQGQTGEPDQRLCSLSLACDRVFYLHRSVLCIRLLLLCWVFSFNWILKLELFSVSMTFPILRTVLCRSTRSRFRITSVPFAKCILLLGSLSQRWSSRCSLQVLSMQTTKRFSSRSEEKLPILILYENLLGVGLDRCISVGSRVCNSLIYVTRLTCWCRFKDLYIYALHLIQINKDNIIQKNVIYFL